MHLVLDNLGNYISPSKIVKYQNDQIMPSKVNPLRSPIFTVSKGCSNPLHGNSFPVTKNEFNNANTTPVKRTLRQNKNQD